MKILILQGANMIALGKRDPKYYGTITLRSALEKRTRFSSDPPHLSSRRLDHGVQNWSISE